MDYRNRKKNTDDKYHLYGKHPVLEALKNKNRVIHKLMCTKNSFDFLTERLGSGALDKISKEILRPEQIDKIMHPGATKNQQIVTHQGAVIKTETLNQPTIEDLFEKDLIVACNKITDPHNIGAIIRNSVAFGANAIVTDERNSPPENATIAKTSAGCIESIPYIRGKGLASSIEQFKQNGFLIIGLDGSGEYEISEVVSKLKNEKIVLVIGSEGKGMAENIIELCDYVAKINISQEAESLNASVASSIALYSLYNRKK